MSSTTIAVDLLALVVIVIGALMVFRQSLVRRWWAAIRGKAPPDFARAAAQGGDPAHYAMIIFGMMLLAFGLIIVAFFTAFELFT
jgi:hypothetical protein